MLDTLKTAWKDLKKAWVQVLSRRFFDSAEIGEVIFNSGSSAPSIDNKILFLNRIKNYMFLRFNLDVSHSLSSRVVSFLPGLGELLFFGVERLLGLLIDFLCLPFDNCRENPVYFSSKLKAVLLSPVFLLHFLWRFTVSMPAYRVAKSNTVAKVAFCLALGAAVVLIILFTSGVGLGPLGTAFAFVKFEVLKTGVEAGLVGLGATASTGLSMTTHILSYVLIIKAWSMIATGFASICALFSGAVYQVSDAGQPVLVESTDGLLGDAKKSPSTYATLLPAVDGVAQVLEQKAIEQVSHAVEQYSDEMSAGLEAFDDGDNVKSIEQTWSQALSKPRFGSL